METTTVNKPSEVFDNTPVAIDLNRYLGLWYEIARLDHSFERGMEYVTAEYSMMDNGKIKVVNSGYRNDKLKVSVGKAKTTETPGLMRVSFFMSIYSDYRVLYIDKDYKYVLVGGSSPNYLWILSRTPKLEDETIDLLLNTAQSKGYKTDDLIWVNQNN